MKLTQPIVTRLALPAGKSDAISNPVAELRVTCHARSQAR
jgi:hypothetical protein